MRYTIFILEAENEGERVRLIFFQASPSVLKTSLGSGSSVRTLGIGCNIIVRKFTISLSSLAFTEKPGRSVMIDKDNNYRESRNPPP
jgi:hypothetical protein